MDLYLTNENLSDAEKYNDKDQAATDRIQVMGDVESYAYDLLMHL